MNKKRKIILLATVAILIILGVFLIVTYALWNRSHEQTSANLIETGCFNTDFEETNPAINLTNVFPLKDDKGLSTNPYSFKLENKCQVLTKYMVKLEITNQTTMPISKVKIAIDNTASIITSNEVGTSTLKKAGITITDTYIIYTGYLQHNEEITHDIRQWIDHSATMAEASNKKIESYITIEAVATNEIPTKELASEIKQQGGGASAIEAKGAPELNAIAIAETSGIYATEDDYGTSYYYRGERDSLNNNLIFAGFQWKIVRINGDGSMRIIYNGTEAQFNSAKTMNTTGVNTQIGTSAFNTNYNDNKYLGYMYGGAAGVASSSRIQAQTNETDSTIKTYIDAWYVNNIETQETTVTEMLADNLFCNDRQLGKEYPGAPTSGVYWPGVGYGTSGTYYASFFRHNTNSVNPIPTLMCAQKNDRFTVNDTVTGNGDLTYPVGLVSADELVYSGLANSYGSPNQFLYTEQSFRTISPSTFNTTHASPYYLHEMGRPLTVESSQSLGVRPVLNLASDIRVTGNGSATNPFRAA